MQVYFNSLDNQNNEVSFLSDASINNNVISFIDKSIENTLIKIFINKDNLILQRTGNIEMEICFIKNKTTKAYYKNNFGLDFEFEAKCHELLLTENRIDIKYDMILDNELLSSHKIWIIIR